MECNGMEWNVMECNGMEWNVIIVLYYLSYFYTFSHLKRPFYMKIPYK